MLKHTKLATQSVLLDH